MATATDPTQTQAQAQQTKKLSSYDPSSVYAWAQAGSNQTDLSKYGINFSQEEQDRIANIFKDNATASYNAAQNQYSQDIANQQATLSDTIRRSQAEAVATGASRGLQAANELSSILGLQQAAAQGATQIQGDYASQLAQAQQQAAELQNQRNQVGAEIASADLAAEAQKYAANMDFAANDFNRVLAEAADLRAQGHTAEADLLLKNAASANGLLTEEAINNYLGAANVTAKAEQTEQNLQDQYKAAEEAKGSPLTEAEKTQIKQQTEDAAAGAGGPATWVSGQGNNGTVTADYSVKMYGGGSQHSLFHTELNFGDLEGGNSDSGIINIGGNQYYVTVGGSKVSDETVTRRLNNLSNNSASKGTFVYYDGKAYVYTGSGWHTITGSGSGASYNTKNYDALMSELGAQR